MASLLAQGLWEIGKRLLEKGVVDVPLEPAKKGLDRFVQRRLHEEEPCRLW